MNSVVSGSAFAESSRSRTETGPAAAAASAAVGAAADGRKPPGPRYTEVASRVPCTGGAAAAAEVAAVTVPDPGRVVSRRPAARSDTIGGVGPSGKGRRFRERGLSTA